LQKNGARQLTFGVPEIGSVKDDSSARVGRSEQVPTLPGTVQLLHGSVQAVSQQTPSAQLPLAQFAASTQARAISSLHTPLPSHLPSVHAVPAGLNFATF
jgi:hypothetical protein